MTFTEIMDCFNDIKSISSTNEKKEYLKNHNDKDFKDFLHWYYDDSNITGISDKKLSKKIPNDSSCMFTTCDVKTIFDVLRYLDFHHTGRDEDISTIQWHREQICNNDNEVNFFNDIVTKNIKVGLDAKLINKVYPNLVPTFDVCLCDKFFDRKELVDGTREFILNEKLDGNRCIAIKEHGNVKLISRQGKTWIGCVDIENTIKNLSEDNFVLDGEILITNRKNIDSKLQYKETTKLISTKNYEKHGLTLNAFDYIPLDEWNNKDVKMALGERIVHLEKLLENSNEYVIYTPVLYKGKDPNAVQRLLADYARPNNWEGIVLKFTDSKYQFKRTKDWLKVKEFFEMDVFIDSCEEGTNQNKGRLGAFRCHINHPQFGYLEMKVGGGFTEDERIRFYEMKDDLIGRVISITYFEVTENTTTHVKSVRFPEFLELKEEGQEPNN